MPSVLTFRPQILAFILLALLAASFGTGSRAYGEVVCANDRDFEAKLSELLEQYQAHDYAKTPRTIGIEIEGVIPDKVDYRAIATIFLKKLRKVHPGAELTDLSARVFVEYTIEYKKNGQRYTWTFKPDPSVNHIDPKKQNTTKSLELISPVLRDTDDYETFIKLAQNLHAEDFAPILTTSGIHIHVGFPAPREAELRVLDTVLRRIEKAMLKAFRTTPERKTYVTPLEEVTDPFLIVDPVVEMVAPKSSSRPTKYREEVIEWQRELRKLNENVGALNKQEITRKQELQNLIRDASIHPRDLRNRTFNYIALADHGTIEFRLYNSTLDADSIRFMIDLSASIIEKVRTKDQTFFKYLYQNDPTKINIMDLAQALGLTNTPAHKKVIETVLQKILDDVTKFFKQNKMYIKPSNHSQWMNILAVALFIQMYANPNDNNP